jgi:hypothetical protein
MLTQEMPVSNNMRCTCIICSPLNRAGVAALLVGSCRSAVLSYTGAGKQRITSFTETRPVEK